MFSGHISSSFNDFDDLEIPSFCKILHSNDILKPLKLENLETIFVCINFLNKDDNWFLSIAQETLNPHIKYIYYYQDLDDLNQFLSHPNNLSCTILKKQNIPHFISNQFVKKHSIQITPENSPLEQKKNQKNLHTSATNSVQTQKALEQLLDQLNMRLSGEFKNALVSIKTFTQLLPTRYKEASFRKDFLNVVGHELKRIENLLETLSVFSSDFVLQMQTVNLQSLIDDCANEIEEANSHVNFKISFCDQPIEIEADKIRLSRALSAIFNNAIDSSEQNGKTNPVILVSLKHDTKSKKVIIETKDQGKGFSKNIQDKVFSPFYSTKHRGLGLGLSYSKRIIDSHNASIELKSQPGGGVVLIAWSDRITNILPKTSSSNLSLSSQGKE